MTAPPGTATSTHGRPSVCPSHSARWTPSSIVRQTISHKAPVIPPAGAVHPLNWIPHPSHALHLLTQQKDSLSTLMTLRTSRECGGGAARTAVRQSIVGVDGALMSSPVRFESEALSGSPPATSFAQRRRTPALSMRAVWYLIIGWTTAYAVVSWLLEWTYSHIGASRPMAFLEGSKTAIYALAWAPLLLIAVWLTDRWPIRSPHDLRRIALHAGASLLAPFAWGTATYAMCVAWVPGWQPWGVGRMYLNTANAILYVYAVVIVISHIVSRIRDHRDREIAATRAAESATQAQLHVLAMELQPHFLFNALHAVSSLIHTDRRAALGAMRQLREMLDHAIQTAGFSEVSLADELVQLRMYTRIQELRYGERLRMEWHIGPGVEEAAVPHFLLQPLIENAIKYSVETVSGARRVRLQVARVGAELSVLVADDGVGFSAPSAIHKPRGLGRGLANARERLWHLYGDRQSLSLRPGPEGCGATVEVRVPFRRLTGPQSEVVPDV